MRILIDMQGAQTESRFRGIGRYSLSLALAIARQRGPHEVVLALNGMFPETIEPIRKAFDGVLPQANIRVWDAVGPTRETQPDNQRRREIAEYLRESFITAQQPDVVLITSMFEGYGDDAITSIGKIKSSIPTAAILYDLIPLLNPDEHFQTNQLLKDYYGRKIDSLRRAQLLLAISESAKQESITALSFEDKQVVNISGAYDAAFTPLNLSESERFALCQRLGINKHFVMYTGGADERKNLHRLIQAYAGLSAEIRNQSQLVFVGKMPANYIESFYLTAKKFGLKADELVVTGFVSDEDLHKLYSCCTLFVFPSTHEGFGIPPLEAMSCGAPVIGADATSLPEVIGLPEALFDPLSIAAITDKLSLALTDGSFRQRLVAHGLTHAPSFSWDASANRAWRALERFDLPASDTGSHHVNIEKTSIFNITKQKILIIKLDHLGDFILAIPAITKLKSRYPYAEIDVVLGSWCAAIAKSLNIFSNIYTFDFFKKKSSESASVSERNTRELLEQLPSKYDFALDLRRQSDSRFLLARVNAEIRVGYETFDPRIDLSLQIALPAHPDTVFEATPLNETPISVQMIRLVDALPASPNDYVSFPALGDLTSSGQVIVENKSNRIAIFPKAGNAVKEWSQQNYTALIERLLTQTDVDAINVYFASDSEANDFGLIKNPKLHIHAGLNFQALTHSLSENIICIANNSFGAHIGSYLGLAVIAIYGGHETVIEWAPVFNTGYVIHHPVACSPCHIAQPSDCPYALRCLTEITVDIVHAKVQEALASLAATKRDKLTGTPLPSSPIRLLENKGATTFVKDLIQSLATLDLSRLDSCDKLMLAKAIATNHRSAGRQIFVDISELVQRDAKSGIQRVVRSVLRTMLDHPPAGFHIVPVYATVDQLGYRKAIHFTQKFIGNQHVQDLVDDPILYGPGDIYLGIDLHPQIVKAQRNYFKQMRERGVSVQFVVYDMLCVMMPQHFVAGSADAFAEWVKIVAENDGAICISKSVADELRTWITDHCPKSERKFEIGYFHLGADINGSVPSDGLSDAEQQLLTKIDKQNNFLMVGTLEPRKGHDFAVSAFENIWAQDINANLIIVGKKGWMVDPLIARLEHHPQAGKRLFWVQGASDELLEKIYETSNCLLVASEGEGFGLPLIEAAHHHIPIVARDLPVFREVAGDHAYYFSGNEPQSLTEAVKTWLNLYQAQQHPVSEVMPWLTWQQSTQQLLSCLIKQTG